MSSENTSVDPVIDKAIQFSLPEPRTAKHVNTERETRALSHTSLTEDLLYKYPRRSIDLTKRVTPKPVLAAVAEAPQHLSLDDIDETTDISGVSPQIDLLVDKIQAYNKHDPIHLSSTTVSSSNSGSPRADNPSNNNNMSNSTDALKKSRYQPSVVPPPLPPRTVPSFNSYRLDNLPRDDGGCFSTFFLVCFVSCVSCASCKCMAESGNEDYNYGYKEALKKSRVQQMQR